MTSRRPWCLIVLAVLCAAVTAGCGGSDARDPRRVLDEAFGPGAPGVRSGRLDVRVDVRGEPIAGLPAPLALHLAGPFAAARSGHVQRYDLRTDVRTRAGTSSLGSISTGDASWVVLGERAFRLPAAATAAGAAAQGAPRGATAALAVDPRRWARELRHRGRERLDGEATEHVSGRADVARFAGDLARLLAGTGAGAAAGATGASGTAGRDALRREIRAADVDVWTGTDDHLLRRMVLRVRYGARGDLRVAVGVAAVNRPQPIGPPSHSEPVADLVAALRMLAARERRRAASGVAGATPYEQCLADAGGDLALAQRCAPLAGR